MKISQWIQNKGYYRNPFSPAFLIFQINSKKIHSVCVTAFRLFLEKFSGIIAEYLRPFCFKNNRDSSHFPNEKNYESIPVFGFSICAMRLMKLITKCFIQYHSWIPLIFQRIQLLLEKNLSKNRWIPL